MNGVTGVALSVVLASLASACGYSFGSGLDRSGIHTIGLLVVGNETYRQRIEVALGAALARELPVSTDLRFADRRSADAVLQVVFAETRERTLVSGSASDANSGPVREGALEAAVRMQLLGRDGRVLIERRLLDRTEFRSPIGEDLSSAQTELVEDLARKIALALESDF